MDIVTSIPARVKRLESISRLAERVYERVARRAYDNFIDRGQAHGLDLGDWFAAERELILRPAAETWVHGEDVVVDVMLPEIDLPHLVVHVAPFRFVVESETDRELVHPLKIFRHRENYHPIFIT